MFGQPAFRNPPSRLAELMQSLRDLESKVRHLDPGDASRASTDIVESVGTALEEIADRFRNGAGYATREAGRIGQRAGAAGRESYEYLKGEVDAHPLALLGVAAGIGLLIGVSLYRRSRNTPPEATPRRRTKRRARK
jgi:ElaB/YqjD/DUF883 family membrane-anchored ribosome-binding protein